MKLSKLSLTILAAASLLSLAPSVRAQTNTPPPARRGPGMGVDAQLNRMTEQLKLTDEQKPKVKAVLEERNKQMQGLRELSPEDRRTKMQSLRQETNKKLKEILTPEQFKKYEEMQRGMRGGRRNAGTNAPAGGQQ